MGPIMVIMVCSLGRKTSTVPSPTSHAARPASRAAPSAQPHRRPGGTAGPPGGRDSAFAPASGPGGGGLDPGRSWDLPMFEDSMTSALHLEDRSVLQQVDAQRARWESAPASSAIGYHWA